MTDHVDEAPPERTADGEEAGPPAIDGPRPALCEDSEPDVIAGVFGDGAGRPEPAADQPASESDVRPILLDPFTSLGDQVFNRLDAIQALLEREARAEATRERVIDRLHAELQEYKQDLLLKVQRPIFVDLIQLHDDIGKMIEARPIGDDEPGRTAAVRGILESIQVAIEDILYRQGVEPFTAPGDGFDPRRQRAVATVPTDEIDRNKTVAGRLRKGFQSGEKLIRPEIVSVYTFRPPAPADPHA
jgi:molecular chaperone GrpE